MISTQSSTNSNNNNNLVSEILLLNDSEKEQILKVLARDEELRRKHDQSLHKLRQNIQKLDEQKLDIPKNLIQTSRVCVRCKTQFGKILNTSANCPICQYKVCQNCRDYLDLTKIPLKLNLTWTCKFCSAKKDLLFKSGEWIYAYRNGQKKPYNNDEAKLSATDIVKLSIEAANAKAAEEAEKKKNEQLSSPPVSPTHLTLGKAKSTDIFSRSLSALRSSEATKTLKAKFEEFIQTTKSPSSPTTTQNSIFTAISEETKPENSEVTKVENTKNKSPKSSPPKEIPKNNDLNRKQLLKSSTPNHLDEACDFDSITSSEVDLTESKTDEFLTKLNNISSSSADVVDSLSQNNNSFGQKQENQFKLLTKNDTLTEPKLSLKSQVNSLTVGRVDDVIQMDPVKIEPTKVSTTIASTTALTSTALTINSKTPLTRNVSVGDNNSSKMLSKSTSALTRPKIMLSDVEGNQIEISQKNSVNSTKSEISVNETDNEKSIVTNDSKSKETLTKSILSNESTLTFGHNIDNEIQIKGTISLALNYNKKTSNLNIIVKKCEGLAIANQKKKTSDPYVKLYLLPDKHKNNKRKTSIQRNTLSPTFDETLRYTISSEKLDISTLLVSVWHHDSFGHNKFLGEVRIRTYLKELEKPNPSAQTFDLVKNFISKSELAFDLEFKTTSKDNKMGILQLYLKNGINLNSAKPTARLDTFVEACLLPDKTRIERTEIAKNSFYPEYDHAFTWTNLNRQDLKDRSLQIVVWSGDHKVKHFLGGIRINVGEKNKSISWMDSKPHESSLWSQLIENKTSLISAQLELRDKSDFIIF